MNAHATLRRFRRVVTGVAVTVAVGASSVVGLVAAEASPPVAAPASVAAAPAARVAPGAACLPLVNAARVNAGLRKLTASALLYKAALAHSAYQARTNRMSHTGSGGSDPGDRLDRVGYRYRTWAENVAMGYTSCASVMKGWMNSPGHRRNILSRNVTQIAVAVVRSKSGALYWTMALARPA